MSSLPFEIIQISELTGHEDRVWSISWNPTRPLLASCSGDKTVRLYSYNRLLSASVISTIATDTDADGDIPIDVNIDEKGERVREQKEDLKFSNNATISTGHAKTVRCVTWAPSGKTFATASFDANISVWEQEGADADGDDDMNESGGEKEWECASLLEGHETECKCIAYSSSGTLLASCSRDKTVWVWEVQPDLDFECMGVIMSHTQDVKCVAWHPFEEILASGSYDDTIKLHTSSYEDDEWYDYQTLKSHTSTVWSLAFSPCGEFLASASDDKTIRIWRRKPRSEEEGGEVRSEGRFRWEESECVVVKAHERSVFSISWAKGPSGINGSGWKSKEEGDGNKGWLASTGGDGKVNVWNISTEGNTVRVDLIASVKDAHGVCDVNCVTWCPRKGFEDMLATAGDDCSVRVWRIGSAER